MLQLYFHIVQGLSVVFFLLFVQSYALSHIKYYNSKLKSILSGCLFGLIAVYGSSYTLCYGNEIFFTCGLSVLSITGIFCGLPGVLLSAIIALTYNYDIVRHNISFSTYAIIISSALGYIYGFSREKIPLLKKAGFVYLFGLLVNVVLIIGSSFLIPDIRLKDFINISIPVLMFIPIFTMILVIMINNQQRIYSQESVLNKTQSELKTTLLNTLDSFSIALESKDQYTDKHQSNVANLSAKVALKLKWDEKRIIGLYIAALVHDIGKISINRNILNKLEPLEDSEISIIRHHPTVGYDIFKKYIFPWPIAKIILQHHECLDGSGYPNSMTGNMILSEAKIISICDTADAITNDRPYRKALGINFAINALQEGKGRKFDEKYADICIDLLKKEQVKAFEPSHVFAKLFEIYKTKS